MTNEQKWRDEWYERMFSYPELKDVTDVERKTLIDYCDGVDVLVNGSLKQHIFDRLETIIWDLVWGLDDMTLYGIVDTVQQVSFAIWILNDKKLPDSEWLIKNFVEYWVEDPKRMREPLNTSGEDGNFHQSIGNASQRFINRYSLYAIGKMI